MSRLHIINLLYVMSTKKLAEKKPLCQINKGLTRLGSTSAFVPCFGNLSSGSARSVVTTLPETVLFGAPPPPAPNDV